MRALTLPIKGSVCAAAILVLVSGGASAQDREASQPQAASTPETNWAPAPQVHSDDALAGVMEERMKLVRQRHEEAKKSQQTKDRKTLLNAYHIFLYPDGRRVSPQLGGFPFLTAARGQSICVHWLIYEKLRDKYSVKVEGKRYQSGATHAGGSFADVRKIRAAVEARTAETPGDLEWKTFVSDPLAGGQMVKVYAYHCGKGIGPPVGVYFERRDRFNLRAGPILTPLGDKAYHFAPAGNGSGSVIETHDKGTDMKLGLSIVAIPPVESATRLQSEAG